MATLAVRTTYSLDKDSIQQLSDLARNWNVTKSEALRRAIHAAEAANKDSGLGTDPRLTALDALQSSMKLTREAADNWVMDIQSERYSSTRAIAGE